MREANIGQARIGGALAPELGGQPGQLLGVAALGDPRRAQCRQARGEIDARARIGIGPGGVVHGERRVLVGTEHARRVAQVDLAHRHAQVGA